MYLFLQNFVTKVKLRIANVLETTLNEDIKATAGADILEATEDANTFTVTVIKL